MTLSNYSKALLLLFITQFAGCISDVKPWQKGLLSKPHMATEPDITQRAILEQIVTSKEASSGGYGVVGGGCGCN